MRVNSVLRKLLGLCASALTHLKPPRYLDSGVHHLAEARAYRWEFRRAIPLQVVTLAPSRSWSSRFASCASTSIC